MLILLEQASIWHQNAQETKVLGFKLMSGVLDALSTSFWPAWYLLEVHPTIWYSEEVLKQDLTLINAQYQKMQRV